MRFLNAIEAEVPAGKMVHVILDNYAGARSAGVRCVLPLARRFCGRRCFDLGSEVSGRHDASAADQCYGRNRIARAAHLNGRIKWSWCPRVDKPIARNHVRRIRRRDRPRIAFWNPSCF